MNLYFSDSSFQVQGQPYEGFPLLVDEFGSIVEIALSFFVDDLIRRSGARDLKTWGTYGRHLYDYLGYCEAKKLSWDYVPAMDSGDVPPLAHYVKWCDSTVGNEPGYTNDKLGVIERFYRWALEGGRIDTLPYEAIEKVSKRPRGILHQTSGDGGKVASTDMRLPEPSESTKVLSRAQIDVLLTRTGNRTHHRMIYLGLNAGLRAEEIITFPTKYVIDCGNRTQGVVKIWLDREDLDLKNDKSRMASVSVNCMNSLWQYRQFVRPSLQRLSPVPADTLFLNRDGVPFVADGLVTPLSRLGVRLGFHVHPHMLRHTFATHTLDALEQQKLKGRFRGSPLVHLQKMLGHERIDSTMRYVHQSEAINDVYGTAYQLEIDSLVLGYLSEAEKK